MTSLSATWIAPRTINGLGVITERARQLLEFFEPCVIDAQLCSWTDSPDGLFIVEQIGNVVLACGDSGEGFKFSALMGEVLADLAEGHPLDDDIAALSLARFAGTTPGTEWSPTALGGE